MGTDLSRETHGAIGPRSFQLRSQGFHWKGLRALHFEIALSPFDLIREDCHMRKIVLVLSLTLAMSAAAWARPACTPLNQDVPVRSTLASAGFFANLRNAEHSVRYVMDELLQESEVSAKRLKVAENDCARACADSTVAVVFSSAPHMTIPEYDDRTQCEELFAKTRRQPIEFLNRSFDEKEQVEDWYKDLTQGDGDDGESLYEQCPGRCSPRYSSLIFKSGDKFVISTSVVCGHARDKDDDQYVLSAGLRWICPSARTGQIAQP